MARSTLSPSLAPVAGVFLLSLALRAAIFLGVRGLEAAQVLGVDAAYYHQRAEAILRGVPEGGVHFLGPLFPHWLATLYRIFGTEPDVARAAQVVLSAATATFLFLLLREVGRAREGFLAALVFTLYGYGSFLDTQLVMAPLLTALFAAACFAAVAALRRSSWRWALFAGLSLGLAAQGRGSFAGLAAWTALCLFLLAPRPRRRALTLALLLGAALGFSPSAQHDLRSSGGRSLLPANGGVNLYVGLHENATGRFVDIPGVRFFEEGAPVDGGSIAEASRRAGRPLDAIQASRWWTREALGFALSHPGQAIALTGRKLRLALGDAEIAQIENFEWARSDSAWLRFGPVRFGVLVGLGLVGCVLLWREEPHARIWILMGLGHLLLLLPFFVTARYRYPLVPLLAGAAIYAGAWCLRRGRAGELRPAALGLSSALAVAAVAFVPALPNARADAVAHAHYTQGVLAMQEGRLSEAIDAYLRAAEEDPTHVPTAANLAWCLLQTGEVDESLRWFAAVRRLEPSNTVIDGFEGIALLRAGRSREAERVLAAHLRRVPGDVEAQLAYGDALLALGRAEAARPHWEFVAREGHPDDLREAARERLERTNP